MRPLKRKIAPRAVRRTRLVFRLTFGATPTLTIGLCTCGWFGSTTRYCVFSASERIGNENVPSPLVRCTSEAFWKHCVYGYGLLCRSTCSSALHVPARVPACIDRQPG